jgi:DNA-directed RNA polymerase specialized sigma24 family protein
LDMMTSEQKQVFCKVYYHGKTIAELSYALNKPEGLVRKDLKDAFTILKQRT